MFVRLAVVFDDDDDDVFGFLSDQIFRRAQMRTHRAGLRSNVRKLLYPN